MIINAQTVDLAFRGFQTVYGDAYLEAPTHKDKMAMTVSSTSADETYGWLGMFPQLREWIGPRHVHNLKASGFTIKNRKFESTVSVERDHISDDKLGIYKPAFSEMGSLAANHPEELVFGLLASGFEATCYDGHPFFADDHPQTNSKGEDITVSNFEDGGGPAWYLLDTARTVKPLIWQEREPYEFQSLTDHDDAHIFFNDQFVYGVRARVNAGFGLWQLGFGSKATLNAANHAAARAAMMDYRSDGGRILGIRPTTLVVPPELEDAALHLLNTETSDGGGSNPWKGTAELIVTPFVKAA